MPDAVRGHLAGRAGERAGVIGLFLCTASRLPELITELIKAKPAKPVGLSLVVDTGLGGLPKAVSIVESDEFVPEDVIRVIEPRRGGPDWLAGVRRVADRGYWPKLRCGGQAVETFPSLDQVADFLAVLAGSGTSFKATAGLHNAVRHTDPKTGLRHHGFLNLLVATARALSGQDVRAALASEDGAELATEAAELSDEAARAVRGVFASYGSCSLAEPVADLENLGLL